MLNTITQCCFWMAHHCARSLFVKETIVSLETRPLKKSLCTRLRIYPKKTFFPTAKFEHPRRKIVRQIQDSPIVPKPCIHVICCKKKIFMLPSAARIPITDTRMLFHQSMDKTQYVYISYHWLWSNLLIINEIQYNFAYI